MQHFEPVVLRERPDWVVVVGDVNSTLACALVCSKLGIRVAHVEAGLRSRDRTMPEEINRVLTDQIADLLLTPSADADRNLLAEGISASRIRLVGNVMIDSLFKHLALAERSKVREELGVAGSDYAVVTLHRPSNVDDAAALRRVLSALSRLAARLPVVFPAHPRTRKMLAEFGLSDAVGRDGGLLLTEPLGYLDFLRLFSGARLVLTDSGGIQEETTALGIPCLTLRENTERPVTVEIGTNRVVGTDPERIIAEAERALGRKHTDEPPRVPPLWDGRTADRILDAILENVGST
jgi:UDP-N-acetylglucosamine 2-epimerase (non-hydrolysing)